MFCRLIYFFVLMCISSVPYAEPAYDTQQPHTIATFRHAPAQLLIDEILKPEYDKSFISSKSGDKLFIDNNAITWVKVEINNKIRDENLEFLLIDNIGINDKKSIAMYATYDTSSYIELPRNQTHTFPVFNVSNVKKISSTYYLKFTNNSNYKLLIPLSFLSAEALQKKLKLEYIIFGGMLFSLLILAFYNILLFFFLKEFSYLSLTLVLLSCVFLLNRSSNVIEFMHEFKEDTYYFYSLPMALLVLIVFYFWKKILFIDEIYPMSGKVINFLFLINLILIPFMGIIPSYELFIQVQFFVLFFILPFATFFLSTKGIYIAKTISILMLVNALSTIPIVLGGLGLIHTGSFIIKLYLFGVVIFGSLMSLLQVAHTRQLRQQTELAEAQRDARDDFLRTISHELRTPMHAVISSGELLLDTPLDRQQRTYIQRLNIASTHMLGLIDGLLNLAKIEMAGVPKQEDNIYLPNLLHDVEMLLSDTALEKQIDLLIIDNSDLNEFFLIGDSKSLHQILINLIYNGIKYTKSGEVSLEITRIVTSEDEKSANLLFEISDTGIGIAKEEQAKLFRPFYRVENQENEDETGSGLGLVITQKLIVLLGGSLELESSPGLGSRFYFTLPFLLQKHENQGSPSLTKNAQSETQIVGELVVDVRKIHILVVDDNDLSRFFTEELLKTNEYQADGAGNGAEALAMLKGYTYDLIFLDLNMPGMSGFEVATRIRQVSAWKKIPIIAFTAHAIINEKDKCIAVGMNDCVSKPLPFKQLDEIIKKYV